VRTEDPTSATTQIGYTTHGLVAVTTDTEGRATTRTYDSRDRLASVTALGVTTSYAYDDRDRLTTVTDGGNNRTVYGYDGLDRRVSVKDPIEIKGQPRSR
jgi:YD repeat-containing protein